MGGYGSGRQFGKLLTRQARALDVRKLQREGLLTAGRGFSWQWLRDGKEVASIGGQCEGDQLLLKYQADGKVMEYPVFLEWTPCNLGGRRAWFNCPLPNCGRRVAILYGGKAFVCRHCRDLAYQCQRETDDDRAMRRADNIRRRLGWRVGIANPKGGKPKGMHWRTFERLKSEHESFALKSLLGAAEKLGIMNQLMTGIEGDLKRDG